MGFNSGFNGLRERRPAPFGWETGWADNQIVIVLSYSLVAKRTELYGSYKRQRKKNDYGTYRPSVYVTALPMLLKNRLPDWLVVKGIDIPFIIRMCVIPVVSSPLCHPRCVIPVVSSPLCHPRCVISVV